MARGQRKECMVARVCQGGLLREGTLELALERRSQSERQKVEGFGQ